MNKPYYLRENKVEWEHVPVRVDTMEWITRKNAPPALIVKKRWTSSTSHKCYIQFLS